MMSNGDVVNQVQVHNLQLRVHVSVCKNDDFASLHKLNAQTVPDAEQPWVPHMPSQVQVKYRQEQITAWLHSASCELSCHSGTTLTKEARVVRGKLAACAQ